MCYFRLLGAAVLEEDGAPVVGSASQPRRIALLSILATEQPGVVSRDKLVALLWPGARERDARHLLSEALYVIRRRLGNESIVSTGENLRLNEDVVRVDVREFLRAIDEGRLRDASELYAGPFLDGVHLNVGTEFERWVERQRRRLETAYRQSLETLAKDAEEEGEWADAQRWWGRIASSDPYDSRVALRYMEALVASGNRAEAVRYAGIHERLLEDDLGVEASPEVLELVQSLKGEARRFVPAAHGSSYFGKVGDAESPPKADSPPKEERSSGDRWRTVESKSGAGRRRPPTPFRNGKPLGDDRSSNGRASTWSGRDEAADGRDETAGGRDEDEGDEEASAIGTRRRIGAQVALPSAIVWLSVAIVVLAYLAASRAWMGPQDMLASQGPSRVLVLPFSVGGAPELTRFSDGLYFLLSHELDDLAGYESTDALAVRSSGNGSGGSGAWDLQEARETAAAHGACCVLMGSLVQISPSVVRVYASLYDRRKGKRAVAETWIELDRAEFERSLPELPGRLWGSLLPALEEEMEEEQ